MPRQRVEDVGVQVAASIGVISRRAMPELGLEAVMGAPATRQQAGARVAHPMEADGFENDLPQPGRQWRATKLP